jgi:type III pantothenate kinase
MILTIDIGNSFTKWGLWEGDVLDERFSCSTAALSDPDTLGEILEGLVPKGIVSACACSVVPDAKVLVDTAIEAHLGLETKWIDGRSELGMPVAYATPDTLGADRVAAVFGALKRYGAPAIVCDFGTATTIDVLLPDGTYAGGIIAPGIRMIAESLGSRAVQLFEVEPDVPESPIGTSTESALKAGVFYSAVGTLETAVERISKELGTKPHVIATGGNARLIQKGTVVIDVVDDDLVLYGLYAATTASRAQN